MFGISEINTDSKVACLYFLIAELWYVRSLFSNLSNQRAQICCSLFSDSPSSLSSCGFKIHLVDEIARLKSVFGKDQGLISHCKKGLKWTNFHKSLALESVQYCTIVYTRIAVATVWTVKRSKFSTLYSVHKLR
jgi:hypothetical protein